MNTDSYDEIPYDSVPIHETHPAQLALLGTLFGLQPAAPEHCRVLEFGCASGGNLIPLAWHFPDSEFVGIERSAEQAAAGRALIADLGLRNIRILQADVLTLDARALGHFDYAVAHGFYSWVPDAVREHMFRILSATLAAQGIGYVSYNVYPGWRWRGMVRDLLRHAVRDCPTVRGRLAAAREAVRQYEAVFAGRRDPVSVLLHAELVQLGSRHPSYLYHEYLVDENTPFLFTDFMARAAQHGLQYLCETELHTMFPDGLGAAAGALVDAGRDIVTQEQTLDLLRMRLFRQTLLCRQERQVERELELERFAELAYHALLVPAEMPDRSRSEEQVFRTPEGETCPVSHPLTRAALQELAEAYPDALAFEELATRAAARVRAAGGPDTERDALLTELLQLFLRQFVGAALRPEKFPRADRQRPRVTALARGQAAAGLGHVATVRHKPMELDAVVTHLIGYLDGSRHHAELAALLVRDLEAGRIRLDMPLPSHAVLASAMESSLDRTLQRLAQQGLLA